MKAQCLGFKIVHVYFVGVGDSVLGVLYLEFFRAKLLLLIERVRP